MWPWTAPVLVCSPPAPRGRAAARRPSSGPIRATARMSGRGRTAPGGALRLRVWPLVAGCWSAPPSSERPGQQPGGPPAGRSGPRAGCQVEADSSGRCAAPPYVALDGSGAGLLPPSSERQGSGQKALQRADPGHGPDVRQRPDGSGRRAAPPCVAPGGRVLVCSPKLREARAAARRPTSGPIRATGRMSGRGGQLRAVRCASVCGPGRLRCWSAPPQLREAGQRPEGPPAGRSGPRPGCQAEAGRLQAARCAFVCGPWWPGAGLLPQAPRGQGCGQKAHQRADPGHGPDVRQRPDGSGRRAAPPVRGPGGWVLVCAPPAPRGQSDGQEAH